MAVDKTIENQYENLKILADSVVPEFSVTPVDSIGGMEAVRCASLLVAQLMFRKLYNAAVVRRFSLSC